MKYLIPSILALSLLAACDTPTDTDTGGGGGGGGGGANVPVVVVPSEVAMQLKNAVYDPSGGTLKLTITGLDAPVNRALFTRTPGLDIVSGDGTTTYQAFTHQTTSQNRQYVALFAAGSEVSAGIVGTEVQFQTSFGGGFFDNFGTGSIPNSGSALFHSGYAGLIDLTPNNTTDRATLVTGEAFMSVNLTEGLIEGGLSNRTYVDTVDGSGQLPNVALLDVSLLVTDLSGNAFQGTVQLGGIDVGDYAGVLGGSVSNSDPGSVPTGTSPAELAGAAAFHPFNDSILEWGVFVAPVCGGPNASPNCP